MNVEGARARAVYTRSFVFVKLGSLYSFQNDHLLLNPFPAVVQYTCN